VKRIVIKLGTGILTKGVGLVDTDRIAAICRQIAELRSRGIETLVVSSGAIGMGMGVLGLKARPTSMAKKQACAAIGQTRLIQRWQDGLAPYDVTVGQILLTHEGLKIRNRYVNAKATIDQLLAYGVLPVINENDSVSSYEIRFGNNDLLGAMVASLAEADHLLILSTAPGVVDMDGDGRVLPRIDAITPEIEALAKDTASPTAVGGMVSKLQAARIATQAGCATRILDGTLPNVLVRLADGEEPGTLFPPAAKPMVSKKRWLAYFQRPNGSIEIDAGACKAIIQDQRSLLAAGVRGCRGSFEAGEVVDILGPDGQAVARGEARFSSREIETIARKSAPELNALYPKRKRLEVVHRDALVLL